MKHQKFNGLTLLKFGGLLSLKFGELVPLKFDGLKTLSSNSALCAEPTIFF